jgi:hypothetical protein
MKRFSLSIVAVILCISVITVAIIAATNGTSDNSADNPTPTPNSAENAMPSITGTPTPSSIPAFNATFTYFEDSRTQNGNLTTLVLSINAALTGDNAVEIDYSKFFLYVWIEGENGAKSLMNLHHYTCIESGSKYLDATDPIAVIRLTFEFPSEAMGFDGYMVPFSTYTLSYSGQQVPQQN